MTGLIDAMVQVANTRPEAIAVAEGEIQWTYAELLDRGARRAGDLLACGVRPGARVGWFGGPSAGFAESLIAAWGAGATYLGLNPRHTPDELAAIINRATPSAITITGPPPDALLQALARAEHKPVLVDLDMSSRAADGLCGAANYPALLVFTTGTTGTPKGALLTHDAVAFIAGIQAREAAGHQGRVLNVLPAGHIGSIVNVTAATWSAGGAVIFDPDFSPDTAAALIHRHAVSMIVGVPTLFQLCLESPGFKITQTPSWRHALSGGAKMSSRVHQALSDRGILVQGMYGQTEVTGSVCYTGPGEGAGIVCDTIGRPAPDVELRLSAGATGEIQVRGPMTFSAYLDDPMATSQAWTEDGWLRTGDLAERRADGAIRLVGRLKEVINTGGYKVMPREVEEVLACCPDVRQSAVVARPDPLFGEAVVAFVSSDVDEPALQARLRRLCTERLANYKRPKEIHVLDELPLIGVGKVDRRRLSAMAATDGARGG